MTLHKSKVLLGPVKEEAMRHHRNKKSPTAETNGEVSHASHFHVGHSTSFLKPQAMVLWKLWGYKFIDHFIVML
jgi:hypothetical protein